MLIPACIIKIINFNDNKGNKSLGTQEDFHFITAMLDNGEIINIEISSNDAEFSNSLNDFINFKSKSITKENEIKQAAYDIMFSDNPTILKMIEKAELKIAEGEPSKNPAEVKKLAGESIAQFLVSRKRTIAAASIIRLAFGTPYPDGPQIFKSRSIQITKNDKGEKGFGNGGLYYFAQTGNVIPIEITQIRKRDGEFTGYFRISTGKLINANQINFLIDHSIRTIKEYVGKNNKPFLLQLLRQEGQQNIPPEYFHIVKSLNAIEKQNRDSETPLDKSIYDNYISQLEELKIIMKNTKSIYASFRAALPLVYTTKDLDSAIDNIATDKGSSPLQNMPKAIANLNFSKENPDLKKRVEGFVYSNIKGVASGETNHKILGTIAFSAPNILGEAKSWGFPINNIDVSKLCLSYLGTKTIIESAYTYVDSEKQQKRG